MALAASQLGFVGPVPVDRNTVERTIMSEYNVPESAAGTDIEHALFWADSRNPVLVIKQAYFTGAIDITKDTTNYITVKLVNRGAAGLGTDIIASFDTNAASGTVAKYVRQAFTVDRTKVIAPGDLITYVVSKTASGQAVPAAKLEILLTQ